jgi:hypothetical protein
MLVAATGHISVARTMTDAAISEDDILRARKDPQFKQVLLTKSLEHLLDTLHRMQRAAHRLPANEAAHMREGALMAVELADRIRAIDDNLRRTPKIA